MITGSHNPPEFNGLKLCVGTRTIYGGEIQQLRSIIDAGGGARPARPGTASSHHILPEYEIDLTRRFPGHRDMPLSVVVDSGNGAGGIAAPAVLRAMGCTVRELYSVPDGRFPHHHPDPTVPGNLTALISAVREGKADLGIGLDGDADRIGVVDEQGTILWGDQLMVLFSRDILKERPGATIVSEQEVLDFIQFLEIKREKMLLVKASQEMSKPSFERLWDNEEDAVYDSLFER